MNRSTLIYVGIGVLAVLAAIAETHLRRMSKPRHRRPPDR